MRVTAEITYDAAPDAVFAMLTDEGFQERKMAETGSLESSVDITPGDGTTVVTTTRVLPTDNVPEAFRSLLGGRVTVVATETWEGLDVNGARTGTLSVEISGAPVRMSGALRLSTDGRGGTTETVDGDLKARVPLLGGRIEKGIEPALKAAIAVEQRIGRAWLADGSR